MTPQRWQQLKETLADALAHESTSERKAFLEVVCAEDPALRREVDALLADPADDVEACVEHASSGALLPIPETTQSSWRGRRVGAYELLRELGRGGMGAVWLAQRADGRFEQQVAVKLLKRGTDTEEVLRRFRAERQILARLEHPNIARLLDGGETDDGLPFFVMEFVAESLPVTDFCRAQRLPLAERLRLFLKICAAVQFAHQRLVIHRDLKPGNILVTPEGEPKLLDFGIAKLLAPDESTTALFTATAAQHQRLTPAYASPEQVHGEAITTASDIYSLGAILYELLSDQPAHAFRTRLPSVEELQRIVVQADPPRPSLRAHDAETRRGLRGDLDTIILKTLHKEPARRYPSVGGLADDLRRYLAGRPVRARPDTWGYRAAKFVRRNKTAVAAGAFVALALAGSWAETLREAARAKRRFEDVRQLAESFLFEFHDAIANVPGTVTARRLVAARGLQYLDSLASEASADRTLQLELAEAYLKVGDVQGRPYTANLGDTAGALRSYEKALAIATPHAAAERGEGATEARRIASDGYERVGIVHSRLNHPAVAADYHGCALVLRTNLERDDPRHAGVWRRSIVSSHLGLGDAIMAGNHLEQTLGDYRAALEHYRRALPIIERLVAENPHEAAERKRLAQVCARIAAMLSEIASATADPAAFREAFAFHERTLALDEALLRADPGNAAIQRSLADELVMTAYARTLARENLPRALAECRRALEIERALAASDATNTEARQDIAHACYVTGRVLQLEGDTAEAAKNYQECCDVLESLNATHPENVETAYDLARARRGLAETTTTTAATSRPE